ncbi:BIIDXI-like protein At5g11420 [Phragmites australis]|uniref:BIIDXI-like protein At5g11420 n=1 Tax=Phragmites australis TaxID=29695 RepID=UPI002D79E9D8|nr:BIIDXI-like protein At5g11420 [Phragmites australis]
MRRESAMTKSTRCMALLLLVSVVTRGVFAVNDGMLPNGNFEQGPNEHELHGTRVMGQYAIPYWEISGFVEYIGSGHTQEDMILPVPEGAWAVRLGNDATIRQQLCVTRHAYYSITFTAARSCAHAEELNVSVTPDFGILPIQTVYTSSGWDSYSWAFKAKHSTVWLSIHNPGHEENPACGPLIDFIGIKTLHPPHHTTGNMLRNGDFEEGPYIFPDVPWGVLVPPMSEDLYSPLPGWMVMSDTKVVKYVDAAHHAVPHGTRAVELVAGRECALLQEVATAPGRSYRLSFSVGDAGNGCEGYLAVDVYAARATLKVPYESHGTGGHKRAELVFEAITNQTRVVFHSSNHHMKSDASLCGPVIDDVSLVAVHK